MEKPSFLDQLKNIIKRDNNSVTSHGYHATVFMSACLVVINPITIQSYDFLFNCTTEVQGSD